MSDFIPGKTRIPASGQRIEDEDVEALHRVVDSRWYTEHTECKKFEESLKKVTNSKYCQLVNSGSSANLVAVAAAKELSVKPQYVLTTAMGFPTTLSAIYLNGLTPVFVDMDPFTFKPDMDQVEAALRVFPISIALFTHTMGFDYGEGEVEDLMDSLGMRDPLYLISDCCDALGLDIATHIPAGLCADFSTYSFFPAHHITTGEGGAVLTDNRFYAETVSSLSSWGRSCTCAPGQDNTCGKRFSWHTEHLPEGYDHKYIFDGIGYNLKMTEFQAALGNSQLSRLDWYVETRRINYKYLYYSLDGCNNPKWMLVNPVEGFSPFGFPIIDNTNRLPELVAYLESKKIGTRRMFGGNMIKQPAFAGEEFHVVGNLVGTDYIMNNMLWISCGPYLTTEMMDYMCNAALEFYGEK